METGITLNKIAYSVAHTLGMDEDYFLREKIKFDAIGLRALFARRDQAQNGLATELLQPIGCIPLICVDAAECCSIPSYHSVLRTDRKVPKPLRTKDSDSFYFVGTIDKLVSFDETKFDMMNYTSSNRYTSKTTKYIYLNEYIYVINPPSTTFKWLGVISVWADPRQLNDFTDCDTACFTDDSEFPMPLDWLPDMIKNLIQIYSTQKPVEDKEVNINNN